MTVKATKPPGPARPFADSRPRDVAQTSTPGPGEAYLVAQQSSNAGTTVPLPKLLDAKDAAARAVLARET